jgi:hypothetical protein
MRPMKSRAWSGLVLAAAMLGTSACGSAKATPTPAPQFVDGTGAATEYDTEMAGLTFPTGYAVPTFAVEPGWYGVGVGMTSADFRYVCAWYDEWLRVRAGDPAAAATAIEHLSAVGSMPLWANIDPGGQQAITAAIEQMKLGAVPDNGDALLGCGSSN